MPTPSEPYLAEFLVGLRPLAYTAAEQRLQAFLRAVRPWNETYEAFEPALSDFVTALVRVSGTILRAEETNDPQGDLYAVEYPFAEVQLLLARAVQALRNSQREDREEYTLILEGRARDERERLSRTDVATASAILTREERLGKHAYSILTGSTNMDEGRLRALFEIREGLRRRREVLFAQSSALA